MYMYEYLQAASFFPAFFLSLLVHLHSSMESRSHGGLDHTYGKRASCFASQQQICFSGRNMHVVIPGNPEGKGFYFFFFYTSVRKKGGFCFCSHWSVAAGLPSEYMDGLGQRAKGDNGLVKVTNSQDGSGFRYQGTTERVWPGEEGGEFGFVFLLGIKQAGPIDVCIWSEPKAFCVDSVSDTELVVIGLSRRCRKPPSWRMRCME